jgi:hypothetical protein
MKLWLPSGAPNEGEKTNRANSGSGPKRVRGPWAHVRPADSNGGKHGTSSCLDGAVGLPQPRSSSDRGTRTENRFRRNLPHYDLDDLSPNSMGKTLTLCKPKWVRPIGCTVWPLLDDTDAKHQVHLKNRGKVNCIARNSRTRGYISNSLANRLRANHTVWPYGI